MKMPATEPKKLAAHQINAPVTQDMKPRSMAICNAYKPANISHMPWMNAEHDHSKIRLSRDMPKYAR